MPRLENKLAIVTGAAHGIGRAIAELFAEEGAWVLVADLDREAGEAVVAGIRGSGGQAEFAHADVTSIDAIERAVKMAAERLGRIDVLVNNAAHLGDWQDVQQTTPEQWERSISTTLMGAVHFTRAVLPWMIPHHERLDHQYRVDAGPGGRAIFRGLHEHEARAGGADAEHGRRLRAARHPRERDLPRPDPHAHLARRPAARCTSGN